MTGIVTKFLGPSNVRGARVKATTTNTNPATGKKETLTIGWDHAKNSGDNHATAAKALAIAVGFTGEWVSAGTDDGFVYVRRDISAFSTVRKPDTTPREVVVSQ